MILYKHICNLYSVHASVGDERGKIHVLFKGYCLLSTRRLHVLVVTFHLRVMKMMVMMKMSDKALMNGRVADFDGYTDSVDPRLFAIPQMIDVPFMHI